jgi:hypothetical protein
MEVAIEQAPLVEAGRGSEKMLAPQEVQRMLALSALGWGAKRISRELGCSRNTVREYLRRGGWRPMDVSARTSALDATAATPKSCARTWRASLGIEVSLRTVQRSVEPLRRELRAEAVATVRYETNPGQQLTSAAHPCRLAARRYAFICSSPRWATAGVATWPCPCTSDSRHGCRARKAHSGTSVACSTSCCWTMPSRWSTSTTCKRAR